MLDLETIIKRVQEAVPSCRIELVSNESHSGHHSLLVDDGHAVEVARFLRDAPDICLDYASNVTGIDWLNSTVKEKVPVTETVEGEEKVNEKTVEKTVPGYLEVVYHLYSMRLKQGPVILRMRTGNRDPDVHLPSLTPVYRSAELQEREVYDLFGIVFDGHPDMRRLLMWEEFEDHPMRKDYFPPEESDESPIDEQARPKQ